MRLKILLSLVPLSSLLLISSGCSQRPVAAESAAGHEAAPVEDRVAAVAVERRRLTSNLTLTAEFRPDHEVDVMAKVSGYLKAVNVDAGDRVKLGQVLATIEIPEMEDDIARNAAAITRSRAELTRANEEVKRAETARELTQISYTRLASVMEKKPGLVAQQEVDTVRNRDLIAQSQIAAAKSALAAAEQSVRILEAEAARLRTMKAYTSVLAPFTGLVTRRWAEPGGMIQAGVASQTAAMPVVRVAQIGVLRLILPVPESAVPQIRTGGRVEVRVPTLQRSFDGRVSRASGQIQPATRTMETQVDVQNPQGVLVPGMFAEAVLQLADRPDALSVPLDAIDRDKDNKPSVLAVSEAKVLERRPVVLGLETADFAEIREGLKEGDLVVTGSRSRFKPGQKVSVKVEAATAKGRGQ